MTEHLASVATVDLGVRGIWLVFGVALAGGGLERAEAQRTIERALTYERLAEATRR